MGVSMTTIAALRRSGQDAVHLRDRGQITLPDREILALARGEGRIVLTFDLDFGTLLADGKTSTPSVIIFRLRDQTPAAVTPRLMLVLEACEEVLSAGAVVAVDEDGYRIRRLPIQPLRRIN